MEVKTLVTIAGARLYVIASPSRAGDDLEEGVRKAISGGADVVQLRDKFSSASQVLETARTLGRICRQSGVIFIVNDRVDIALASGADGVHLGQDDLPVSEARNLAKRHGRSEPFLIGCSTHSLEQALLAQDEGADYIGCGPVFSTPTKPDYRVQGLELVRQYREQIRIPFVAIGGIDEGNIAQVAQAGARCAAVVRAVLGSADPEAAARSLKNAILTPTLSFDKERGS